MTVIYYVLCIIVSIHQRCIYHMYKSTETPDDSYLLCLCIVYISDVYIICIKVLRLLMTVIYYVLSITVSIHQIC